MKKLIESFTALMLAIASSGLTGCGGSPASASDSDIQNAVRAYYTETGIGVPDEFVKIPKGMTCLRETEKITLTDIRVVKRGKPFQGIGGTGGGEALPVRVFVKGTTKKRYGSYNKDGIMQKIKQGDLPFEGEIDFQIQFEPPDKSKVEPGPGKWIAVPAL